MKRKFLFLVTFLVLGFLISLPAMAQVQARSLITGPIDKTKLVTLHGTVNLLARTGTDLGAVSDSFAAERLVLILNRPPEREAALRQFLENVQTRGSASYHKWLTPAEFGAQFGPADSDMQAVTGWLRSQGFQVVKTSESRQFIEFSGTAGQLREAFHTTIHRYSVAGESHYANSSEVEIPAALASLVRGISPMNDFRAKPYVKVAGTAFYSRSTGKATPQWTIPNPYGTANPYAYTVTPEDFATQYDLAPLYQAGTNGAGETIGIINESNIDLSLVEDYQSLFGVAGTTPQVVIDGDDPGDVSGADAEAYLDVELSGAVAPKATVDLYISNGSDLVDPVELAALRAVEDNEASVLSVSFGSCEASLGVAGNQFWAALWEQAAAQGQTVFVATGDSGPECNHGPLSVNGLASTPWDVAIGGTDFYYSDYASGGASMTTLWNATNDANLGSLKAPLPEQAWDDPFGLNVIPNSIARGEYDAGGGGASNCSTDDATTGDCSGGYAKPDWQTGPGVPADNVRDLPDLSLYASNGANLSAYAICSYEGACAQGSGDNAGVELVGGTSASAPAMAGIMALIDQRYGRQGQANTTFYPLAQQKPAAFHDITVGSNSEICGPPLGPD
ncbi:MAG: S53 family peptidase, partial [Acidobacteriaceae bacterium]